ncbi:PAS domain-containing sensor histidine kinase, partial [Herbaspirillum sp. HC18]
LHRLVAGAKVPMAAFGPDGLFAGASEAARALLGFRDLFESGLERARGDALREGRAATPIGIGQMVLQRVGTGADVGLVALIEPAATAAAAPDAAPELTPDRAPAPAMPEDARPAVPEQAPSGIALFDAFADPVETSAETAAPMQSDR